MRKFLEAVALLNPIIGFAMVGSILANSFTLATVAFAIVYVASSWVLLDRLGLFN